MSSAFELCADELRGNKLVRVDLLEQAPHDRRLPRANLAGDDDEALTLIQPYADTRTRACARGYPK